MVIKEISYKDERLEFFMDKRKEVQKTYDRLEKQIKPDARYLSERVQLLSDCGRELNFYNDVIEMLENGVVSKSEAELYQRLYHEVEDELASTYDKLENAKGQVAKQIVDEIIKLTETPYNFNQYNIDYQIGYCQAMNVILSGLVELKKKYSMK